MILNTVLQNYKVVLASKSPRRHQLLNELGIRFTVATMEVHEGYPPELQKESVALYLAEKKSDAMADTLKPQTILITADTIVCIDDRVLNKPAGYEEAVEMLKTLSGRKHEVITGVCLRTADKKILFHEITSVYFKRLSDDEIGYYLDHYQPYDKAGAYGVQEWIGLIGLERIDGSFHNVMGLPVQALYQRLNELLKP